MRQRFGNDEVPDAGARQAMALGQRSEDEDVVEPAGEPEDIEVTVAGRDRELEVDLVDDDDRLEAVGDRGDLGQGHAVPGGIVR